MIIVAILFLAPLYYLSKSKGFNAVKLVTIATLLSVACTVASFFVPYVGYGQIFFPAIFLLGTWVSPPKKGAPGKAYFKITFNCPECKKEITFKREKEGSAELCPECGEVITVPEDEASSANKTERKPPQQDGKVQLDSFGWEEPATTMKLLLEGHGIKAEVIGLTESGVLGAIGAPGGYKVVVDSKDWEAADKILKDANQPAVNPPVE